MTMSVKRSHRQYGTETLFWFQCPKCGLVSTETARRLDREREINEHLRTCTA